MKIDMGAIWAHVYSWILRARRGRVITRETARREMTLCNKYLGEGKSKRSVKRWMKLTIYDELREMAETLIRGES